MASFFSAATSALLGAVSAATDVAKGWGQNIQWVNFKDGMKQSKDTGKPAMVVIHKSWCRACKALKPRFANNKEIEAMSNNFIMINVEDDDEPKSTEFKPDGAYIPRILFLDGEGKVMAHVQNKRSDNFKYYYPETELIVDSMRTALKQNNGPVKTSGGPHARAESNSRGRRSLRDRH